ncbi:hypothetical protein V499_03441 [Pseudogymnoascus sp. VKM F-103]|nr:hypothetical protein V499_03441 [Pseudogymnoascus sp. VKM F-103]
MSWARLQRSGSPGAPLLPLQSIPIIKTEGDDPYTPYRERSQPTRHHTRSPSSVLKTIADDYATLTPAETAARLQSSLTHGLPTSEAFRRLQDHGPNELPHAPPEPLWLRFAKQFMEPMIVLLLCSAGLSLLVGNKDDALSISIAVTIVVAVAFVQEYRSEKSIEALNHLVPNHAHLIRAEQPRQQTAAWSPLNEGVTNNGMATDLQDETAVEQASTKVMASTLVPGDLVLFTTGDRIPADIRVTKASDLTIDESNLTGENEPVRVMADAKRPVPSRSPSRANSYGYNLQPATQPHPNGPEITDPDTQSSNRTNIAYMGTLVRSGYGQGIVYATGGQTHFGAIAASVTETESPRTPLQVSMDALGAQLSQASGVFIALIAVVGWFQGKKILDIFTISISLAVAAIPEGLPIIVTVTLALGVHRMARHNAIVRRLPSVETLGSVNVVCSDKTGTLTMNHMTTTKMWYFGASKVLDVETDDSESSPDSVALHILRIGNIANNARVTNLHTASVSASSRAVLSSTQSNHSPSDILRSRWVGAPTDVAMMDLVDRYKESDIRDALGHRLGETPFSSERKWMGVTLPGDRGRDANSSEREVAYMKGAIDRVLSRCDTYVTSEGREIVLDSARRQEALEAAEKLAAEGLRVLAFASGTVARSARLSATSSRSNTPMTKTASGPHPPATHDDDVYNGLTFAGIVGMSDPPRYGVTKSISTLMKGGVRVIMITGDAEATAVAIAKKLGMPVAAPRHHTSSSVAVKPVLTGNEIDDMTDEELKGAIGSTSIFARTSPDHKLKIIRALQARGDIVAMTGDGVNDAPALKKADIGISMGLHGTDVAKEAADMILTDDDFSTILHAIEEGKGIFSNVQNFLTFQLSTSAAALSLVFICTCLGYRTPLNAMQILWINIIMDGPPAQSLGVEPVDADVMAQPPRRKGAPVLTRTLIQRVLTSAFIIMAGTMLVYTHEMLDGAVSKRDTTMTFTCFVLFDMFNALSCRSESKSVLRGEIGLFSNTLFNWAPCGVYPSASYIASLKLELTTTSLTSGRAPLTPPTAPMSPLILTDGYRDGAAESPSDASLKAPPNLYESSTVAEIRASLAALHTRDSHITTQLRTLLNSQADLSRELGRLDLLRAHLGTQVVNSRSISHGMLDGAARSAAGLSSKVKALDLEKTRVEETLGVVEQVAELKACVQGVMGSMGAPQDWEAAASYLARASKIPDHIITGAFAARIVPSVEIPDPPAVTLENAKESLCGLFLREFEKAAKEGDGGKVTRFFKLFPLIGRGERGLDVYGKYVCGGVSERARATLREATGKQIDRDRAGEGKDGFFYANALTKLFEHIAQIVDGHGGLVERHYGDGRMVRVVERLQQEADVQGGIVLDTWGDERGIERRLTDVKSYPFSFLVQSFLPSHRAAMGTTRTASPGVGGDANPRRSEDEGGVDMKEIDGILNETGMMLGRWSLYCRFLASKTKEPGTSENAPLSMPPFLTKSALSRKISSRLTTPFDIFSTFFFRRSVEKAFQLDETPSGLSLNPSRPLQGQAPYIISAVDDVMYIVSTVLQRSVSTAQRDVIASVIPTVGRVLGSDFVGMVQRKMRDESYPKPAVQGGLPPEDKIIAFIVLINSLDVSNEYISRIIATQLKPSETGPNEAPKTESKLHDLFPFDHDSVFVENTLRNLETTFSSKTTELLNEALTVLFNNVVKPRLRPIISDTFRDIEYSLSPGELADVALAHDLEVDDDAFRLMVPRRFEAGWDALMRPLQRLMTEGTYAQLLESTATHLGRALEKRIMTYAGKVNGVGGVRMERDYAGIVSCVAKGGSYALRDGFARGAQVLMVANMEEDEWEEVLEAERDGEEGITWVIAPEERAKARGIVRV